VDRWPPKSCYNTMESSRYAAMTCERGSVACGHYYVSKAFGYDFGSLAYGRGCTAKKSIFTKAAQQAEIFTSCSHGYELWYCQRAGFKISILAANDQQKVSVFFTSSISRIVGRAQNQKLKTKKSIWDTLTFSREREFALPSFYTLRTFCDFMTLLVGCIRWSAVIFIVMTITTAFYRGVTTYRKEERVNSTTTRSRNECRKNT